MKPVPLLGEEKESLHVALERARAAVVWKLAGLGDVEVRRVMTPSGTTLLGLVKHLAFVEYGWFCETFGRPYDDMGIDTEDPDDDLRVKADESTEQILEHYTRACAAADVVINELSVEDHGRAWFGETVSMRWVLIHMVEETARHAGHMDILRELIDGEIGTFPQSADS